MVSTWLITGCSSSFGQSFVQHLRESGENVIATGRNANMKLEHLRNTGAAILELDVTTSQKTIGAAMDEAWSKYPGGIDVVVNNAGLIVSGAIEELTQEDMELAMKTNFHGPLNITRAVLPKMRARGSGTLLYVSSQAAWHADPGAGSYCASKAALESAIACLAKELALVSPNINILTVDPGYFRTKVFSNINHVDASVSDYAQFNAMARQCEAGTVGKEPGDVDKGVARMIDLAKGTGAAKGKKTPARVPLGSDGLARMKEKCEETLAICEEWEGFAKSTDIV